MLHLSLLHSGSLETNVAIGECPGPVIWQEIWYPGQKILRKRHRCWYPKIDHCVVRGKSTFNEHTESIGKRKIYETGAISSSDHMSSSSHQKNNTEVKTSPLKSCHKWTMFCLLLSWCHWSHTEKHPKKCCSNCFCCPPEQVQQVSSQAKEAQLFVIYVNKMYIYPNKMYITSCKIWLHDKYYKVNSLSCTFMHYIYFFFTCISLGQC